MAIGLHADLSSQVSPTGFELDRGEAWQILRPILRAGIATCPFALALLIGLVTLPAGSFSDEGEILMVAARVAEGERLYRDVFTHHFPLPYALVSLLFGLTGRSLPAARLMLLGLAVSSFAMLGMPRARRSTAGLACLAWIILAPFSAANLVIYPVFSALALLLVFVLGRDLLQSEPAGSGFRSRGQAALLGLAAAAAGLTDPLSIYPVSVLALVLLLRGLRPRRDCLLALVAALLVLASTAALAGATGVLDDFWRDAVRFNLQVYPTFRPDAGAMRLDAMADELRSGLSLGDPRFWSDTPMRSLRLAQIDDFDAWLFTGAFFRWSTLAATLLALLAARPLGAAYTLGFGAALLSTSDAGFRSLPFQAMALWLAAEQVMALRDFADVAADRSAAGRRFGPLRRLRLAARSRAIPVTAGIALVLGGWLLCRGLLSLWQLRDGLSWQANIGAFVRKADDLRQMADHDASTQLAWYPYEPYLDFFAELPPLGRFPNLLPWTAKWADAEVAARIARSIEDEAPALIGFDAARWFWIESFDTGSHAPQSWRRLQEGCVRVDVDLYACGMPKSLARSIVDLGIPSELPLPELRAGSRVRQSFRADCAGLTQISVKLATYARRNAASIEIALLERRSGREEARETGRVIGRQTLAGWQVLDNGWQRLEFVRQPESEGREYWIELGSDDGRPGNALTAWRSAADHDPGGELVVNGSREDGDLVFAYACVEVARR